MGPVHVSTPLLDTHPLLWALGDDARLPGWLREELARDPSAFGVSDVCLWEIAIKHSTGKLRVPPDLPGLLESRGFQSVSITREQVWAVRDLPLHHRDPFDRLLVSQAFDLSVPLVTSDAALSAYDVAVMW